MIRESKIVGSLIGKAHELISEVVSAGDVLVDATIGNGHDTLFLAQKVGAAGKVIGFDIQQEAVESTRHRLQQAGVSEACFELHHTGHELMGEHVSADAAAVMFNLGYLPGGDKETITRTETTLRALEVAISLLKPGGILSVMCYPGHSGGDAEALAVVKWFDEALGLASSSSVTRYQREGAIETTPFLLVMLKESW